MTNPLDDEDDPYACGGGQATHPDHDVEWTGAEDGWDIGHCRNCGAEFMEEVDD